MTNQQAFSAAYTCVCMVDTMVWQDFIFAAGSIFSILVLMPTLRDLMASIPLGTSVPSAVIGLLYGSTFFTMDMTFSAVGSFATGVLWSLIATFRSPESRITEQLGRSWTSSAD